MSRAKRLRRLVPLGLGVLAAVACGGPQEPGNAGTDCFRDDDCEPGLVCAAIDPAAPGDRVCTDDVSSLVSTVPGPVGDPETPPEGEAGAAPLPAGGAPGEPAGGAPSQPATGGTSAGGTSTGGTGGTSAGGTSSTPGSGGVPAAGGAP